MMNTTVHAHVHVHVHVHVHYATHSLQATAARVHFSDEAVEPPHDEEGAGEAAGAGVDGQEAKVTQANRAGKLPVKLKAEAVLFDPAVAKSWAEDASSSTEIMLRRSKVWLAQHEARSSGGDSSSQQLQEPSEGSSHLGV